MVVKTITPKPGKDIDSLMIIGAKDVIQINSNFGGACWCVSIPLSGFDVYHDTKEKSKSYGT